ncbi:MAG: tetratricopeptide repeat protein, partial [Prochlorococcus sp.]
IEINPQSALAYSNRCVSKSNTGSYKEAITDCDKAIEIDPKNALAYANRGNAKAQLGDKKDACTDHKKSASLGHQGAAQWLKSEQASWCRNMP